MGAFLERGRILFFQHGRYADAECEFLRALQDDPDSAEAHALLGLARNRLNRADEALASCREAVRLAPEWSYPHYALGYVLEKNDRFEEAAQALEEAIRLSPLTAYFHSHLAFTRHRQGRYADALACADEGLRCDGQHVDSLNRRAMALAALDRFEEAEQASRTAASLAPEDASTLGNFGYVLYKRNKAAEALGVLRETLRLDPDMAWAKEVAVDALAALLEQGREKEAMAHLPASLRRAPHLEAARGRLFAAAMKPARRRTSWLIGLAWAAVTVGVGLLMRGSPATPPSVSLGIVVVLGVIPTLVLFRPFVLTDPLADPLGLRGPARLFCSPREAWKFAAVVAPLTVAAAAAVAVWLTDSLQARVVLFVSYAQVLPLAVAVNPETRGPRGEMGFVLMAVAGMGGGILLGVAPDSRNLLGAAEVLFLFSVCATALAARLNLLTGGLFGR